MSRISESEEMYLVTIAQLLEEGYEEPIPLSKLAEALSIMPVSVNQMVKKMEEEGYLRYQPYRGAELSEKGRNLVQLVLRHRRLWEVFLVDHLELSPSEADALACRMEHITPREVAEKLSVYLDHPDVSPQGKPIPTADGTIPEQPCLPLSEVQAGEKVEIFSLETGTLREKFLETEGFHVGAVVEVEATGDRGTMLLITEGGGQTVVTRSVAEKVLVRYEGPIRDSGESF